MMPEVTVKALKTLSLQVTDEYVQDGSDMMQLIDHECGIEKTPVSNEYTGKWKIEIHKPSETDFRHKTFYVGIEIEGTFAAVPEGDGCPVTEHRAKELLLPHLKKKLRSLLEIAGIPADFVPETILEKLVVPSVEQLRVES